MSDKAMALAKQHGGYWGEHPDHPVKDWADDAANGETRLGYWDWVIERIEQTEGE